MRSSVAIPGGLDRPLRPCSYEVRLDSITGGSSVEAGVDELTSAGARMAERAVEEWEREHLHAGRDLPIAEASVDHHTDRRPTTAARHPARSRNRRVRPGSCLAMVRFVVCTTALALLAGPIAAQADVTAARRWFATLGYPAVGTVPVAEIATGAARISADGTPVATTVAGFVLRDDGASFSALLLDLAERTFQRTDRAAIPARRVGYVPLDLESLARERLDAAGPATGVAALELFVLSEACRTRGLTTPADDLADLAHRTFERARPADTGRALAELLARELAELERLRLIDAFGDPAQSATELRERADRWLRRFAGAPGSADVRGLRAGLERHLAPLPAPPVDASDDALARHLVAQLHTQHGSQWISWSAPDPFTDARGASSPAHRLVALGLPALPALADAWDDATPSRTVAASRERGPAVVRVGELARLVAEVIAGYPAASQAELLRVVDALRDRGPAAVFAEGAVGTGARGVRQAAKLAELRPAQAVAVLGRSLAAEPDGYWRGARIALLAGIDRDDARALIDARLASATDTRELTAAAAAAFGRAPDRALAAVRAALAARPGELTGPDRALLRFLAAHGGAADLDLLTARAPQLDRDELEALADRRATLDWFAVPAPFGGWLTLPCAGPPLDERGHAAARELVRAVLQHRDLATAPAVQRILDG
ncbi:MAG: hypothetical protein IPM29_22050 [Planctomycetes bacterium]|nr:hypothetical protein [Planctomycetota bacterium]